MKASTHTRKKGEAEPASPPRASERSAYRAEARRTRATAQKSGGEHRRRTAPPPERAYLAPLALSAILALMVLFLAASSGP